MAIHSRRNVEESEEESVFISMTDLMISILFIIMILMAYFSLRTDPDIETVEKTKYEKVLSELEVAEEIIKIRDLKIEDLELQIKDLKQRNSDLLVIILGLKQELLKEQQKLILEKAKRDELVAENTELRERIIILEESLKNYDSTIVRIKTLERKLKLLEKQVIVLKTENKKLTEALEGTVPRQLSIDKDKTIDELREQIDKLREQILYLEKELKNYEKRSMETVLNAIARDRRNLLESIERSLENYKIYVEVNYDSGTVRFGEKALRFGSAMYELYEDGIKVVENLAKVLSEELPCFTLGPHTKINEKCNPNGSIIETIQIEGHTDNVPINKGIIQDNLQLSTMRAAATWRIVAEKRPKILEFFNAEYYKESDFDILAKPGQAILSVSGYGAARPVTEGNSKTARAENRRIDLRFIMMTPRSLSEAEALGNKIKLGLQGN